MKKALVNLLASILMIGIVGCASSKTPMKIEINSNVYQFADKEIPYSLVNTLADYIDYSSVSLERKLGDDWGIVPSTEPDPVAWCGTLNMAEPGETQLTIPFLSYNGTLMAGIYRIVCNYTPREESENNTAISKEFTLAGEFPMQNGYPPPANVYLKFDSKVFSQSASEINYKIINESGEEVYVNSEITLMLYQNSEWKSVAYVTGVDCKILDEDTSFVTGVDCIASTDKEIFKTIDTTKIPGGFGNCTKLRIIEKIAIPMYNIFYAFYEIDIE